MKLSESQLDQAAADGAKWLQETLSAVEVSRENLREILSQPSRLIEFIEILSLLRAESRLSANADAKKFAKAAERVGANLAYMVGQHRMIFK